MTRSLFDPTGDETERGRSQFLGPAPTQHSKMPLNAIDGKTDADDDDNDGNDAIDDDIDRPPHGAERTDERRDVT